VSALDIAHVCSRQRRKPFSDRAVTALKRAPRAHSAGFLLTSVTRDTRRGTGIDPTIPALLLRTAVD
jgi:hypothetical protein